MEKCCNELCPCGFYNVGDTSKCLLDEGDRKYCKAYKPDPHKAMAESFKNLVENEDILGQEKPKDCEHNWYALYSDTEHEYMCAKCSLIKTIKPKEDEPKEQLSVCPVCHSDKFNESRVVTDVQHEVIGTTDFNHCQDCGCLYKPL